MSVTLNNETKAILTKLQQETQNNPKIYDDFMSMITESPTLAAQLNQAVENGHLKHIRFLPNQENEAKFDEKKSTLVISSSALKQGESNDKTNSANRFWLARELQRVVDIEENQIQTVAFQGDVEKIALRATGTRDYTDLLDRRIQEKSMYRAKESIMGWNEIMVHEKKLNPNVTPLEVAGKFDGMHRFFDANKKPIAGLQFEEDGSIKLTPKHCHALSDYELHHNPRKPAIKERIAADALSEIANIDQRYHHIHGLNTFASLDIKRLGIHPNEMQEWGMSIKTQQKTDSFKVLDTSDKDYLKLRFFYAGAQAPKGCAELKDYSGSLPTTQNELTHKQTDTQATTASIMPLPNANQSNASYSLAQRIAQEAILVGQQAGQQIGANKAAAA